MLSEHLLYAKHHAKPWRYTDKMDQASALPELLCNGKNRQVSDYEYQLMGAMGRQMPSVWGQPDQVR